MAIVLPKFPRGGIPGTNESRETSCPVLARICGLKPNYSPGETLDFEVVLNPIANVACNAVEVSLVWYTEGKGSEDLNVHYFRRLSANQLPMSNAGDRLAFQTVLPSGPMSYRGRVLKICWAARVRVFLTNGDEGSVDRSFELRLV